MGNTGDPAKSEVPTVLFFLCDEATHSGIKVFRAAGGTYYTRGKNGRIAPQFATVPPFRSPCCS